MAHTLWAIPFSHYCEYARWALQRAKIPFQEACVLPLLHFPALAIAQRVAGYRGPRARNATSLSTPLLLFNGGGGISDSSRIAAWARARACGDDAAATAHLSSVEAAARPVGEPAAVSEVVRAAQDVLGPAARRYAYSHVLYAPLVFLAMGVRNAHGLIGGIAAVFWVLLSPLLALGIRRALRVDPAKRAADAQRMRDVFARAGALLESQPYLGGAEPSDADFAFASIGAIAVLISPAEGYGCAWMPCAEELPADMRDVYAELRATRAGQHIVKMYALHRRV